MPKVYIATLYNDRAHRPIIVAVCSDLDKADEALIKYCAEKWKEAKGHSTDTDVSAFRKYLRLRPELCPQIRYIGVDEPNISISKH